MNSTQKTYFNKKYWDIQVEISHQIFEKIPSYKDLWNRANEASIKAGTSITDPVHDLLGNLKSLLITCEQSLYAIECLKGLTSHEASNITEFYVSHYLFDFIIRVKTGTDLLALVINQIYKMRLPYKMCSLESGTFAGKLRSSIPKSLRVELLAREIDRTRNNWLSAFDNLRDLAIHRAGLTFIIAGSLEFPIQIELPLLKAIDCPIQYDPMNPMKSLEPFIGDEPLAKFLHLIRSRSVTEFLSINPITFCEEIWELWSASIEKILILCREDLLAQL